VNPAQIGVLASAELAEAVRWYEERRPGLGGRFFDAVNQTVELIQTHPEIGVPRIGRLPNRQLLVTGFPYKVVYRIRETSIYVVAVAHTSRRPNYWQHRG
jgi:plasmid stabilization system protein ParE